MPKAAFVATHLLHMAEVEQGRGRHPQNKQCLLNAISNESLSAGGLEHISFDSSEKLKRYV